MDIAVNLVESYLRLNGYLTLSEMEIQKKMKSGLYETLTDVDIVALRFPGQIRATDPHAGDDCRMLLINDDVLELESETIDVIIGEVKQGEAVFNPGLTRHEVLHTVLHRVEWIYAAVLEDVIGQLTDSGVSLVPARSGGLVRTRLVAGQRLRTSIRSRCRISSRPWCGSWTSSTMSCVRLSSKNQLRRFSDCSPRQDSQ